MVEINDAVLLLGEGLLGGGGGARRRLLRLLSLRRHAERPQVQPHRQRAAAQTGQAGGGSRDRAAQGLRHAGRSGGGRRPSGSGGGGGEGAQRAGRHPERVGRQAGQMHL